VAKHGFLWFGFLGLKKTPKFPNSKNMVFGNKMVRVNGN
jgi:hypothetical protein